MSLLLSGCVVVPFALTGVGAYAFHQVSSRHGPQGAWDDWNVRSNVYDAWSKAGLHPLDCIVFEGRVMVYGQATFGARAHMKVARTVEGVLKVVDATHKTDYETSGSMKDSMLKAKIKTILLSNVQVQSRNYALAVKNEVVYLVGTAYTKEEEEKAIESISNTMGVRRFEYDIAIADGPKSSMLPK